MPMYRTEDDAGTSTLAKLVLILAQLIAINTNTAATATSTAATATSAATIATNTTSIATSSTTTATKTTAIAAQLPAALGATTAAASLAVALPTDFTAADNSTNSTTKVPTLGARANAADPAWTEGRQVPLSSDLSGHCRTAEGYAPVAEDNTAGLIWGLHKAYSGSTNATSSAASAALVTSAVIKAGPGRLYKLDVLNTGAAIVYVQLFNSTTVPADTAVPIWVQSAATAGANMPSAIWQLGKYFSTGIAMSSSSTVATKTIKAAELFYTAENA